LETTVTKEVALSLYRTMNRIRRFEESVSLLYAQGEIPGFVHLYLGEEAVAAGICHGLTPKDCVTSTHRGHGHCLAKGASMNRMMAELFGKKTGYCRGKGGSMHIADLSVGILGANGIVGGGIPATAGAAAALDYKGDKGVAVAFFGDGATNTGAFHETCNLAATWKLPLIFVCENNLFALSVPLHQHQNLSTVASRAAGYEMRARVVDGNDVLAVLGAAQEAIQFARKGMGPSFIECKTYRWRGHSEGDPLPPDLDTWKSRCPLLRLRTWMQETGLAEPRTIQEIDEAAKDEVTQAIQFARSSPAPSPEEARDDLYTLQGAQ
jgi:TPP-dependent pyruvate/acetoin dehydrogenase alpha subunit